MHFPEWRLFYCPHCQKQCSKDDPALDVLLLDPMIARLVHARNIPMDVRPLVQCPACKKPISLEDIHQGRYDSPRFTLRSCLLWSFIIGAALVVAQVLLGQVPNGGLTP